MRITSITVYTYFVKYNHGTFSMSNNRTSTGQPSLVIRITTSTGLEGWAETAPLGSDYLPSSYAGELAALKELTPYLIGLDPRSPGVISDKMNRLMMSGMAAKSVIDMACWDILGKSVGLPTYVLLGGKLSPNPSTWSSIGFMDHDTAVQKAISEATNGITRMQIKVGNDPLVDAKRVNAIRTAVSENVHIWADANASWSLSQALTFSRALNPQYTVPIEQPCKTLLDCAHIARLSALPVLGDECIITLHDLITAHANGITGVNIKLSRVGGFTKARVLRDVAVELGMDVNVHDTWGCVFTTAQNLQLAVSTREERLGGVDVFVEWTGPVVAVGGLRVEKDGRVAVGEGVGNGYGDVKVEMLGEPVFSVGE